MQITGRVTVKVGGDTLRSKPGAVLNLGGVTRNTVLGDNGVHGYSEESVAPSIECNISHGADTDLTALSKLTDTTISFETDSGKSYVLRNAWLENPPQLTGGEGEVPLRFSGMSAEEIT